MRQHVELTPVTRRTQKWPSRGALSEFKLRAGVRDLSVPLQAAGAHTHRPTHPAKRLLFQSTSPPQLNQA
jgi:hypothetical protein